MRRHTTIEERHVSCVVQGDSGGPLSCQDQRGIWFVVGITSFGVSWCSESFDTRVTAYIDWIQQTLDDNG